MAEIPAGGAVVPKAGAAKNPSGAAASTPPATGAKGAPDGAEESPEQALGPGGTSLAKPEPGEADKLGGGAKAAGAVAAVPLASAGSQVMFLMMFMNYLKGLAMTMMAVGMNVASSLIGIGLAAAKAVVGTVMSIGGAVSGAVGGAISAMAAGVGTVVAGFVVGAIVVGGVVTGVTADSELAFKDGITDCRVTATTALDKVEGADPSVSAKTLANAKTVFGVLSAWGMPDENVAGILGNWDAESGVDPTSVEGFFDDPQKMTDEKQTASTDANKGIGLGQWTFGRNENLRAYSAGHGKDWWTLEMQLGFMLSAAEGSDAGVVRDMISNPKGTPADAAMFFHDEWERSADTPAMAQRRGEKAAKWMGMFSGWTKNQALADSILAQAGATLDGANTSRAQAVRSECRSVGAGKLTLKEGGLTLEEATAFMEVYRNEGRAFLDAKYPGGSGPGDCGNGDKSDNCVGFSIYFVNKFTTFDKYARGDGIDTAGSLASMLGKELTKTPSVYSVVSGPASGPEGHTFVILGIQGDQAVIGEANCGTDHAGTRARLIPLSELTDGVWDMVDVSDIMLEQPAIA